jgi:hypothetical protein
MTVAVVNQFGQLQMPIETGVGDGEEEVVVELVEIVADSF